MTVLNFWFQLFNSQFRFVSPLFRNEERRGIEMSCLRVMVDIDVMKKFNAFRQVSYAATRPSYFVNESFILCRHPHLLCFSFFIILFHYIFLTQPFIFLLFQ